MPHSDSNSTTAPRFLANMRPSILIVDDQPSNIQMLRKALAGLADMHFAIDGPGALDQAMKLRPALILLDIDMPGMDGYAVLAALRAQALLDDALVMFITSHAHQELSALRAGGIDFLQKPLDQVVARARVENLLELSMAKRQLSRAQRDLETVLFHLPAFVAQWDRDLRNLFCNDRAGLWFGASAAELRGRMLADVAGPAVWPQLAPWIEAAHASGDAATFDLELPGPDGEPIFGQAALVCQREHGVAEGYLLLITDVTPRRRAELALRDEQERMRITLHSIGDAVIATDMAGLVTFCNPIAESMTGWLDSEACGQPIEQIMPLTLGIGGATTRNPVRLALAEQRIVGMALDCCLRRRDGRHFAVEDSAAPIRDHAGIVRGAIIVFHDVSETRAMAVKMTHLANHDPLTNLPNRMLLRDRCEQALQTARRHGARIALLTIDVDDFKMINASAGYSDGDSILQSLAQRLRGILRATDTLSREGSDEFLVLLSEVRHVDEVNQFCQRVRQVLAEPFHVSEHTFTLKASIGIALFPDDSVDVEQLYSHANSAAYRAKREGRNCWRFYSHDIEESLRTRMALQRSLQHAMETRAFDVYYQPKVDLLTGAIVGAEALVRWRRGDGVLVGPADFIAGTEESGLIVELGLFVLEEACRAAQLWQSCGAGISVAVNVSPRQLTEDTFAGRVSDILERTRLPAGLLQLEITEGTLVNQLEHHRTAMEWLKDHGVLIAIDDFGTGYSSLSYLKRFPIDVLKIDQHFVRNLLVDRSDRAIITAIVQMAQGLGLQLVAEGVEDAGQAETLAALGCRTAQGYFYGRPMPLPAFRQLLESRCP
ncbi:EAL domain-containing protein [Massilia jejuensis]|uniref:EAL domain-containing protein n=1 Tax=Massilia jejuensis TaxID=648894 RepID=A0ABW0PNC5_9BURK